MNKEGVSLEDLRNRRGELRDPSRTLPDVTDYPVVIRMPTSIQVDVEPISPYLSCVARAQGAFERLGSEVCMRFV